MMSLLAVAPGASQAAQADQASGDTWNFFQSEITGGGLAMTIAVSPDPGHAAVGGDSWGLYTTNNSGKQWWPAMRNSGQRDGHMTGDNGTFYYSGLAYSKDPSQTHVVYGLLGRCGASGGGFIAVDGDTVRLLRQQDPTGAEPNCKRQHHPRPTGNRLVVDWDSPTEYIYAAGGGGTGVWRSTNGGADWTNIARLPPDTVITGMALLPDDPDSLAVVTQSSTIFVLSKIRSATTHGASVRSKTLPNNLQFEEVANLGGTLFAAARRDGVYTSQDGLIWSPKATGISSGVDIVTVGGSPDGARIYAGCIRPDSPNQCIYRTKNMGGQWTALSPPSGPVSEWGSNQTWWHSRSTGRRGPLAAGGGGARRDDAHQAGLRRPLRRDG